MKDFETPQPEQSSPPQPPIDDFERKMKLGKIRMNKNGVLEEIPDDEPRRKREQTVFVDPNIAKEAKLAGRVEEARDTLERARRSLERATENPAGATIRGDIESAAERKVEAKAAFVRDTFERMHALEEAQASLERTGNIDGASALLDAREKDLNEKIRAKTEEHQAALSRGDTEGARVLGDEREKLLAMRETISRANQELRKL